MSQKGLAPILIVLILAALVGGYLIYQNQPKPTPLSSETSVKEEDETDNWKTYATRGVQMKYPNDWFKNNCGSPDTLILNPQKIPVCATEPFDPIVVSFNLFYEDPYNKYTDKWEEAGYKIIHAKIRQSDEEYTTYTLEKVGSAPAPDKLSLIIFPVISGIIRITINDLAYQSTAEKIASTFETIRQAVGVGDDCEGTTLRYCADGLVCQKSEESGIEASGICAKQ